MEERERAILERIEQRKRSTFANWFHNAVRSGCKDPAAVVEQVKSTVFDRRKSVYCSEQDCEFYGEVLGILHTEREEAEAYAAHVLAYESLPPEEKEKEKQRRRGEIGKEMARAAMVGKPATDAQLWRLSKLGYSGPSPCDRAEACELIDALMR